ncbi:response regulator [Loktanella sp. SALINAS62]|uniref:response regulator n=1 Tax=Loktanella sp. SALINAS62 TaxID=2706124 RepID=UPI001B8CC993|nr:response regulator [Loktanella sp. SALINAS62]MBS1304001.1 response regulator [Loktanella sp. SALINAS62]
MDNVDTFMMRRPPTALRPLLGLTVLLVEDSRFACEAVRMMCMRSGARIRRADSVASAMKHLSIYRPNVLIIDIGLPDGCGLDLIAQLSQAVPRIDVILGSSGNPDLRDAALSAGADGFMEKPIARVSAFQTILFSYLPVERQPAGPRLLSTERITPDPLAYRDDLKHAAGVLEHDRSAETLDYIAQFLAGVASSADDRDLQDVVERLLLDRKAGLNTDLPLTDLTDMVTSRLKTAAGF